jgi:kynurenine formamidase
MTRIIELGHAAVGALYERPGGHRPPLQFFSSFRAMVVESVGSIRHEVSVPFHDSQVRGIAFLIQTGWDQRWDTEAYWEPAPFLAEHLIFRLVRAGVRVVGVDFPVSGRTTETRLITTGKIPIVENLHSLASLPRVGFLFSATPFVPSSEEPLAVQAFAEIP